MTHPSSRLRLTCLTSLALLCCAAILPLTSSFSPSFTTLSSSTSPPTPIRQPRHLALPLTSAFLSPFLTTSTPPTPLNSTPPSSPSSSPPRSFHPTSAGYSEASITLSGCSNVDFSASVYIEGQGPFNLIVDTGSTTLAVASDTCQCNGITPTFDRSGLPTTLDEGKVGVHYADGSSWAGAGYTGQVSVGDPSTGGSLPVSMVFGTIDTQSSFINYTACGVRQAKRNWHQGIIGFAFPSIASSGTDAWFTNYVAATGIANEFSLQMCTTPTGATSGNLWLGALDLAFVGGQFTYISIVKQQHYNVFLNSITVNPSPSSSSSSSTPTTLPYDATTYGPCNDATFSYNCAVIDSGTTFLSIPAGPLASLITTIQADPSYQSLIASRNDILGSGTCYPLSGFAYNRTMLNALLPTLSFTFGDTATGVNPSTITITAIDSYLVTSYDSSSPPVAYLCPGLASTGSTAAILGFSFMSQFTVRHDIANSRIGFAPTAQCGQPATIMPDLRWEAGQWGGCSAVCGGGVQWRAVNCTDIFGAAHPAIDCTNGFAGPSPPLSQSCNTQACAVDSSSQAITALTSPTNMTQGGTYSVVYAYTGQPAFLALYLQPVNGSTAVSLPVYVTRNASVAASAGGAASTVTTSTYTWTVPPTVPAGVYYLAGYTQSPSLSFVSTVPVTVHACSAASDSVQCGADPCDSLGWCNGHGQCDSSSSPPTCTCVAQYNGSDCSIPPSDRGCSIQCLNSGYADPTSCTCVCPSNFDGVLCELRYATITGVFGVQALRVGQLAMGADQQVWAQGLAVDVAFALGLPTSQVAVTQIIPAGNTGSKAAVTFTVSAPTTTTDLLAYLTAFATLLVPSSSSSSSSSYTSLSQGLVTQYLTSFSVVSLPPQDDTPSDDTGESIINIVVGHIALVSGVGCGVVGGLMMMCLVCILVQRRETRKTLSHAAHRRRKSVLLRERLALEDAAEH